MNAIKKNWKLFLGLSISFLFLYLAFRKVNFSQMMDAFSQAQYLYVIPAILLMFFSHWLRSIRWQYLLNPIKEIKIGVLLSSLLIGYMANVFLPAHLGEFLRAYMVGKKKTVSSSAVFGTIVIERIIDVFTMLILMALAVVVFPFPPWVRKSGYISFAFIFGLFLVLILMKKYRDFSLRITEKMTRPLPHRFQYKINDLLHSFLDGIVPLRRRVDYLFVSLLSLVIWACYGVIFQIVFYAFDFVTTYHLPWSAALVLLVITTISVLVPSSPGYVGTYHYLCQLSLGLFGVPESPALTFAFVMHGINFFPVLIVGLILVSKEGVSLRGVQKSVVAEGSQ